VLQELQIYAKECAKQIETNLAYGFDGIHSRSIKTFCCQTILAQAISLANYVIT
jgi:hypothetical protein